ncbi:hypothetical protein BCR42DRAFT_425237 [Absidia repens]|uniref:Uncharacterized protein n=1 Tax=Absidia repens TaxID=90262 RepID=A0A1X2I2M9_9FUNG|nr:hypothetical protein BCR42DRAFT_425237 [Absidia repens]
MRCGARLFGFIVTVLFLVPNLTQDYFDPPLPSSLSPLYFDIPILFIIVTIIPLLLLILISIPPFNCMYICFFSFPYSHLFHLLLSFFFLFVTFI